MQFKIGDIVVFKDPRVYPIEEQEEFVNYHGIGPFVIRYTDSKNELVYIDTPRADHVVFCAHRFKLYLMFIDD